MNIVKKIRGYIDDLKITLETATELLEAENELCALVGSDFMYCIKPVLKDLSEYTGKPYGDYLEEAKQMILSDTGLSDVLYHFDMLLCDAEEGDGRE